MKFLSPQRTEEQWFQLPCTDTLGIFVGKEQ